MSYSRLDQTSFRRSSVERLRVLVVGAGAIGNEVVKTLGLLGVGAVTVVDPDAVEASNLTRSILFRGAAAVGRNKAAAAVTSARALFPDTITKAIETEIADVGFAEIRANDLITSCVDNDLARLELSYISTQLNIPVADGGLGTSDYSCGRISVFPGTNGACFGCRLTGDRRRELLTLWEATSRPCWLDPDHRTRQGYPSTPMMASLVAAVQVELGLRRVLDDFKARQEQAITVDVVLDPRPKLEVVSVPLSQTCPFHCPNGSRFALHGPSSSTTVRELLDLADGGAEGTGDVVLVLDWPICESARCLECSHLWSPMKRLSALRKSGICPACGSRRLAEQRTLKAIGRDSPWASWSISELGLPDGHLHLVEKAVANA